MFALFFSLYVAMFTGTWNSLSFTNISSLGTSVFNTLGKFITSIFGDNQLDNLGSSLFDVVAGVPNYITVISFILALITSIGIVIMAVKGVKKAFGIFFGHIR